MQRFGFIVMAVHLLPHDIDAHTLALVEKTFRFFFFIDIHIVDIYLQWNIIYGIPIVKIRTVAKIE